MEALLGVTRLGLRGILTMLEDGKSIERMTVAGSHLYSAAQDNHENLASQRDIEERAFSSETLNDFDASIAHLDDLLARGAQKQSH